MSKRKDLTTKEVADIVQQEPVTVKRWIKQNKLRAYRLPGGSYRIPQTWLEDFRQRHLVNKKESE